MSAVKNTKFEVFTFKMRTKIGLKNSEIFKVKSGKKKVGKVSVVIEEFELQNETKFEHPSGGTCFLNKGDKVKFLAEERSKGGNRIILRFGEFFTYIYGEAADRVLGRYRKLLVGEIF